MTECPAIVEGGSPPVLVDRCDGCSGLWLDANKLAAVCPTLADLPARRFEVALLGRRGAGIAACPRCQQAPFEFAVLEVKVDLCVGCGGVWLDGDEYDGMVAGASDELRMTSSPRGGPYRMAAKAARTGEIDCAYCGEKVPLARSYMREGGLVCAPCHFAREQRAADLRAAEVVSLHGFIDEERRLASEARAAREAEEARRRSQHAPMDEAAFEREVRRGAGPLGDISSIFKSLFQVALAVPLHAPPCGICGARSCPHRAGAA